MIPRTRFVSALAGLCLALFSCSVPGMLATLPATAVPTLPPLSADTSTLAPLPADTPAPTPSATPTLASTDTPSLPPAPVAPTPTLGGPAIAHLVPGQKIDIMNIHMIDANQGWGIGGVNKASDHVFRTADGGQTWRDVTPPQPAPAAGVSFSGMGYFLDADTAWVAYGYPADSAGMPPFLLVWKTEDGGNKWTYGSIDTSVVSGEAFSPYYFTFTDTRHGWLMVYLGAGMMHAYVALFMTNDGGVTWTDILDPYTVNDIQSFPKTGMVFVDSQTGWLTRDANGVDPSPHIFRTSDGGATWTRLDLPAPADVPNLFDSYACGSYSPNAFSATSVTITLKCLDNATYKTEKDYTYFTGDGGGTWQTHPLPAGYVFGEGVYFSSPQSGLALGRKIYQTSDAGKTWTFVQQVTWDGQFSFLKAAGTDLAWASGVNDQGETGLVTTQNGGKTWKLFHPIVVP